jgi:quinol monooxygenase YgiN
LIPADSLQSDGRFRIEFANEVDRLSVEREPGVVCLFPMQSAEDSTKIRILEIYASEEAYQQHLKTDHFQKYKQGTLHMVKDLKLSTMKPLDPETMKLILGTSEQYVGRALRDMALRDDVVVATKFLPRTEDEIQQGIGGRQHVLNNIDLSLQHLGMDYVNLYIYHIWDYKTPAEEIIEGTNEAIRQGKARYIGIANVYAYQLAKMNALAEKHGWAKFVSVQNHYNLSGVMAVNKPVMSEEPVWVAASRNK